MANTNSLLGELLVDWHLVSRQQMERAVAESLNRDLPLGLADASVIATAEHLGVNRVLTVDQRHFRAVRPRKLSHLILLPADES